jgi:hypothetical protein
VAIPWINTFCAKKKTSRTGRMTTVAAAIKMLETVHPSGMCMMLKEKHPAGSTR